MSEHVAAGTLAAYVDGTLAAGERPGVEAHLSRCGECREALAEVLEMRASREQVPAEFLRRALGGRQLFGRVPPARLAFGIAAVFLVAVAIGYFFIPQPGEKRAPIWEKGTPRPGGAAADQRLAAKNAGPAMAGSESRERVTASQADPAAAPGAVKTEKGATPAPSRPQAPAVTPDATAAEGGSLPMKQEAVAMADQADEVAFLEEEGAAGAVPGGAGAPLEKDKERAMMRAAAPSGHSPSVRIEGDVARDDLLDPGMLDGWGWFPAGKALELTIDASGAVKVATPLGKWEGAEAERAAAAAGKLAFRPSAGKVRRAVLSRAPLS